MVVAVLVLAAAAAAAAAGLLIGVVTGLALICHRSFDLNSFSSLSCCCNVVANCSAYKVSPGVLKGGGAACPRLSCNW